jgi:carbonic anhydrase/acetyltransferase-like protein (isoleucine patch superfamily)
MELRIDSEGRLVLPPELLQELGWKPETMVEVERAGEALRVRTKGQGSAVPASTVPPAESPSPYGSGTPAGVDTASLKDEARRLADAMRNIASPAQPLPAEPRHAPVSQPQDSPRTSAPTPQHPITPSPHHPAPTLVPHHGQTPRIPASCYVAPGAFLAGEVTLGEECSIWPGASLRGDVNRIEIGPRSNVQDNAVIHANHGQSPAILGSGVTVGHQAMLHGCLVEDDALIGIHAVVLDGARLGKGCMVGAGAVVPPGMEIPPGKLALGVPAKVIRDLTPAELEANRANAAEYVRLRGEYLSVFGIRCSVFGDAPGPETEHRTPNTEHRTPTPVYRCRRVRTPVEVDGALEEEAWRVAEPASAFLLSDGSGPPRFPTEARLCWDETHLYVAFSCQDSDIWGTYARRDDPLYDEEVVEIFLCPTGNLQHYFEFEVSPCNTLFDAKVFNPELERRTMLVDREWDAANLRTAVRVSGTIGRRDDHDIGWIAEMAIPFRDLGLPGPPAPHEQWRMNLFRIERGEVEEFSAWSPTLKSPPDFHVPSRFGTLVFVDEEPAK